MCNLFLNVCASGCVLGGGRLQLPDCTALNSIEDKQGAINSERLPDLWSSLLSRSLGRKLQHQLKGYAGTSGLGRGAGTGGVETCS